ncbi:MAG: prepilin-type N-terminal cleavage/methylation domain-containing protein [bacterium]
MKNSKGFTLIELIAVVAIIAILAAVILPNVFGQIRKARVARNLSEADDLRNGALQFFADVGIWPARAAGTTNGAIDKLLTNATPVQATWRGPYMDKAPRTGSGFYNSQYGGCMFMNDLGEGSGDDDAIAGGTFGDKNGNGVDTDRYVLLGNVPAREANDTDVVVDGVTGIAAGAVIAGPDNRGGTPCNTGAGTGTGDWAADAGDLTEAVIIIINEGT